ncbi:hypothetical protein P8452_56672 [Trifolium repens]|nr:hypothetical protein P8452_56672 [Trifolium repens]
MVMLGCDNGNAFSSVDNQLNSIDIKQNIFLALALRSSHEGLVNKNRQEIWKFCERLWLWQRSLSQYQVVILHLTVMGLHQSTVGKGGLSSRLYELNMFHWCDNLQVSSRQMCPFSVYSELVVPDILCFGGRNAEFMIYIDNCKCKDCSQSRKYCKSIFQKILSVSTYCNLTLLLLWVIMIILVYYIKTRSTEYIHETFSSPIFTGLIIKELAFLELCQKPIPIHSLVLYIETKLIEAYAENADSDREKKDVI